MPFRGVRSAFYGIWAVVLTALTYVLGATPLKVLRARLGRPAYWLTGTALSAALFAAPATSVQGLGLAFFSLVVLVGTFAEMEETGLSLAASVLFTLVINALVVGGVFALWIFSFGPGWSQAVIGVLEDTFRPVAELNPNLQLNYASLLGQLPSIVLILWLGALYLALLLESRLGGVKAYRAQLAAFRLPDAAVWLFIGALLGAFGHIPVPGLALVSNNVLNVCLLLFFFQGIAVVARYLGTLRFGVLPQTLLLMLVVLHLFWFVSLIGLTDYWLDFRARIAKRGLTST